MKVNNEELNLIGFWEKVGGTIRNGSTKGDWEGKLTYIGEGTEEWESVLDLVIEIYNESGSLVKKL